MDIETDPNLPPVISNAYMLPLKHQEWNRKELEDLENAEIIQRSLSSHASSVIIVCRKYLPGSLIQGTQRRCVNFRKLNTQLLIVLGSKSSGAVTLIDIPKIDEMLA